VSQQPRQVVGRRISHYQILSLIGAGGMGEVYIAQDTRLGRKVALKLLPAEFTEDPERARRFEREARAASALNHPNIITIYDIEQVDGLHFIVTEYVEGQTLRNLMPATRVSMAEALEIAIQVAGALAAAHRAGIVHRDIKPENIMLREDGVVKVVDFGLAKLAEQQTPALDSEAPTIFTTDPGTIMGSVSYMSPEQTRGKPVDTRSDIFSLGVVIYEMVAGSSPFEGETPSDVIASILRTEPLPLAHYSPDIPAELERIVAKALAKDKEERYQTAQDLLIDLKRLKQPQKIEAQMQRSASPNSGIDSSMTGGGEAAANLEGAGGIGQVSVAGTVLSAEYLAGAIKRHKIRAALVLAVLALIVAVIVYHALQTSDAAIDSIAVLPLVNMGSDPNAEYLSEGIADGIANSLAQLPGLRVVPLSKVSRYKDREVDPQEVGHKLGVRSVLVWRIAQRGDGLNIRTELVDVANVSRLWGQQYDLKLSDLLSVQEEISRKISERLGLSLTGEQQRRLTRRYTENTEAYQLYLQGRYQWNRRSDEGLKKGIEYFKQAIDLDPSYGLAYAGLADCYNLLGVPDVAGTLAPREAFPKAKVAALKALEIDDALAEAHNSLAFVRFWFEWDWPGADREFKRAIELNPNYATTRHWHAIYLMTVGRNEEAIAEMRRAQELEPLSLIINTNLGWAFYYARQYDQAIEQYKRTLEMDADFANARLRLGEAYEQKGMYEDAATEYQKAVTLSRWNQRMVGSLGHAYAASQKKDEARKVVQELKENSKVRYVSPITIALVYVSLGQKDEALAWLERGYEERESGMMLRNPQFDSLRSDPRFDTLMRKIGLPP
jgi:TolB-like protein/Tfp pilus assembly protein PilF